MNERVVERQLLERVAQLGVARRVGREDAGEHHRLDHLEAGQRRRRPLGLGDGVADLGVGDLLDVGDDEADLADRELVELDRDAA